MGVKIVETFRGPVENIKTFGGWVEITLRMLKAHFEFFFSSFYLKYCHWRKEIV